MKVHLKKALGLLDEELHSAWGVWIEGESTSSMEQLRKWLHSA